MQSAFETYAFFPSGMTWSGLRFRMRCVTRTTCALIDKTVSRFGRLDAAMNCTGTESTPGPLTEQTAETYAGTFDTNVLGKAAKHEARNARDACPGTRQHREHIFHLRPCGVAVLRAAITWHENYPLIWQFAVADACN